VVGVVMNQLNQKLFTEQEQSPKDNKDIKKEKNINEPTL